MWISLRKSSGSPTYLGDFFTWQHRLAQADCLSIILISFLCTELDYISQPAFQSGYMTSHFSPWMSVGEALGLLYANANFRIPSPFPVNWGWYAGYVTGSTYSSSFFSLWVNHRKGITSLWLTIKIVMSSLHFCYIKSLIFLGYLARATNITLLSL